MKLVYEVGGWCKFLKIIHTIFSWFESSSFDAATAGFFLIESILWWLSKC